MVRALVNPVDGVGPQVEGRRWVWPLLLLSAAVSLSGASVALKWDGTAEVLKGLGAGELSRMSERELLDQVQTRERTRLVGAVAAGIFLMPLSVLGAAVSLKLGGWLLGAKATFAGCFTAAAVAMLPVAVFHLILAAAAFRQVALVDSQLGTLVPSSLSALFPQVGPRVARCLSALDFFNLWSAVLLGIGYSAASGMRRGRAVLFGLVLYLAWAGAFLIGLPGLGGGRS